jgi:hypothetical protein
MVSAAVLVTCRKRTKTGSMCTVIHMQEEDEDGEYVYCHECNHPIHAYEEKVYNTDGKLICEDCLNGM